METTTLYKDSFAWKADVKKSLKVRFYKDIGR